MKYINKHIGALALGSLMVMGAASCNNFEDINTHPGATGQEYAKPDYALTKAIKEFQQDPNDGERLFPYNWSSIARVIGDNGMGEQARYSDEYNGCMYRIASNSIKYSTQAIELAEENTPPTERDAAFYANVREYARVWRTLVIADFTDCFGPYPLNAFQGQNPTFNSVEEVYNFMLAELAEASAAIDPTVEGNETEAAGDPAFRYNGAKWQKLANSLRLRLAMRLSEVAPEKARAEFEAAAKLPLLTGDDDLLAFQEYGGWSVWEGVYNRPWGNHNVSQTMVNILTGLGATSPDQIRPNVAEKVKPMDYLGLRFVNHYPVTTDNPTNGFFLDGVPEILDPRALVMYSLPNDPEAPNFPSQAQQTVHAPGADDNRYMIDPERPNDEQARIYVDATYAWNGAISGARTAWLPDTYTYNRLLTYSRESCPYLGQQYRDNSLKRVFFGPWETYFLLAEGAVRGWTSPMSAQAAYENGIRSSFAYQSTTVPGMDITPFVDSYIASTSYNRVGTSVAFTHTAEPQAYTANYIDGYTGQASTITYNYPDASKALYKGGKLNDQLTKIITQKYIANAPYQCIEIWNDRRRLGLPFFEVMPIEIDALSGSDKNGLITSQDYKNGQKWEFFTQRMRYPTSLENADKAEFERALQLLGASSNTMMTPLWWAIK